MHALQENYCSLACAASLIVLSRIDDFLGMLRRLPMITQLLLALVDCLADLTLEDCWCALSVRGCVLLGLL